MYIQQEFDFAGQRVTTDDLQQVAFPTNDNQILWNLQAEYLQTGNQKVFAELWQRFTVLCLKACKKALKKKSVVLSYEELQLKADEASFYVMKRYEKAKQKGKLYIIKNFVTSAHFASVHALFSDSCNDFFLQRCISLDELMERKKL